LTRRATVQPVIFRWSSLARVVEWAGLIFAHGLGKLDVVNRKETGDYPAGSLMKEFVTHGAAWSG